MNSRHQKKYAFIKRILFFCLFQSCFNLFSAATAQITPDNTLGAENSRLTPNIPINGINYDFIDGGAQRGANLFHSFSQFNINDGQRVYFINPSGVGNILTRVTGGSASNIFGTLGVLGNANLFLINPNGIVFGQNARLDVRGSFVATTANGVKFGEQGLFSATNPEAPPLLNVNPSALFFNQLNQGKITVQSKANAGISPTGGIATGLRVPNGESLLLVGGDININGGELKAFGGNIELAGLSAPGDVGLNFADNNLSLIMPDGVERADVSFTNGAVANVRGDNGGNIKINARNIKLTEASKLRAGIDVGLGTPESQGGNVVINATGTINFQAGSLISNILDSEAVGKTGDIQINTDSLNFDRSYLNVINYGQGSSGTIFLKVKNGISLSNVSGIYGGTEETSIGNSGGIQIEAGSLSLASSEINSTTYGIGNAGDIRINVRDAINLNGGVGFEGITRIITGVATEARGKAGNIQITTGSLDLKDRAFIFTPSLGAGDAGNITINARDNITFENASYARNGTASQAVGNGGEIRITTGTLSLSGGSQIDNNIEGRGDTGDITINARDSVQLDGIAGTLITGITSQSRSANAGKGGNIQVTTDSLSLTNGATLNTTTGGQGNAGDIIINAQNTVTVDGFGKRLVFDCSGAAICQTRVAENGETIQEAWLPSNISSSTLSETANGGNIRINTKNLFLKDGGRINADAISGNDGGNIFVQALDTVSLSSPEFSAFSSQISSGFLGDILGSTGKGGNINIQTGKFLLNNSALLTTTLGQGNSGNIFVDVQNSVSLINSRIFSNVEDSAIGNGGNIDINAKTILLDNSLLFAPTGGVGNAGKISVQAIDSLNLINKSSIFSSILSTAVGNGGDINILTGAFSLDTGSTIVAANLGGQGLAGDISISTENNIDFAGKSSIATFTSGQGNAGKINLQAGGNISITDESGIVGSVDKSGIGNGSDIAIQAKNFSLNDGGILQTRTTGKGNAGNISIKTIENLNIDKGILANTTNGQGDAGKIALQAGEDIYILGNVNSSDISLGSSLFSGVEVNGVGKGGDIEIQSLNLFADGAKLLANTVGQGKSGNIQINTTNNLTFKNGAQAVTSTSGQGDAGNVKVTAGGQVLFDGVDANGLKSGIQSTVGEENFFFGTGKGGNIDINARDLLITNNAQVSSSSFAEGNAGDIFINSDFVQLNNNGKIAAVTNSKDGGNINLKISDFLLLRRNSSISTTAGLAQAGGNGGNITINSPFIVAVANENSDISANAFTGKGGNVNISTQAIFGIAARPQQTNQSDITASSELGVQGQIIFTQPQVQTPQKLIELPTGLVDATTKFAQTCPRGPNAKPLGSFVVTGRGSLPPNSFEPLTGTTSLRPLASLDGENADTKQRIVETDAQIQLKEDAENSSQIIEAQGLVKTADGNMMLVAQAPTATPAATSSSAMCPGSE
ncbi:filamentous hemagglutinin N-terminal domain-containing protein [Tolypothrix sp. PCC 7910]|uniref:two-partner secretion domain-containing protein n=1 Tax=Tolypothrix sp. PCC 7910 TaxID=2099387 RepID=UPI0014278C9A|nr:filamentous hemagglutinin N-terminal domain-containing protein [Tolypothrix sp. PCC 7910]QIR37071.1 filamentous hemagglutinin N-terminal domain-containing protein [Tolypothrix sp. PCC 7910]